MISFEPLIRQLKEKSISHREFERMLESGENSLVPMFTGKVMPYTDRIEQICKVLNCSISDVIKWTDEKPVTDNYIKVNWAVLQEIVDKSEYSMTSLALAAGFKKNSLRANRDRNGNLKEIDVIEICKLLNCNKEDVIEVQ